MYRKLALAAVVVCIAVGMIFALSANDASAKKRGPVDYQLDRSYDQTDGQIKSKLLAGWQLGGMYRECGESFGVVQVTTDVGAKLLPVYEKLAEKNRADMLALLKKTNTTAKAMEILDKIIAGKERLTKYGSLPEYKQLQENFEKINKIIAEIKSAPEKTSGVTTEELLETLDKFVNSGGVTDANDAKKAIMALGQIIENNPDGIVEANKGVDENLATLEKIRKSVRESLEKADKLGGGCRMVYVFYRPI